MVSPLKTSSSISFDRTEDKLAAAGERGELGVLLQPCELDLARRPVAVLAHDDLGYALVVGVGVIVLVAVQKHHHVRVLLDGARVAEVREHRALVVAGLDGAGELRYREDGDVEVAGEYLEAAADLRDLLLAVLLTVAGVATDHE